MIGLKGHRIGSPSLLLFDPPTNRDGARFEALIHRPGSDFKEVCRAPSTLRWDTLEILKERIGTMIGDALHP